MSKPLKTAAFFDLDDTIIVGTNTLYLYVKYLVKNKMMARRHLYKGIWLSLLHKFHLVNIEHMLDNFAYPYRGKSEAELIILTQKWFDEQVIPYIAQEAIEKIKWHRSNNHITVLLTSATQYVCNPLKEKLKLDHSINTQVEVIDGILTGYLKKPLCYEQGKVHYAKKFAKDFDIDLNKSYFYTDSISDLPMLDIVGNPMIINPDPLLNLEAKKRGWKIEPWVTKNIMTDDLII